MKDKVVFLVGPTGVGKTDVAVSLAKKTGAEIVSCDSMQVYIGMDIITSKPGAHLRRQVAHHLLDVIEPSQEYNAASYRKAALKKIKEIIKRKKVPVIVGGTGLYLSVLVDGIFKAGPQNKNLRARLYAEAKRFGNIRLFEKLRNVDPDAALKIHPNDTKRIIRALEVYESTGRPISQLQKQRKGLSGKYDLRMFCLNMERKRLYKRIDERVDKMFAKGLLAEVRKLLRSKLSKTASFAIGIKEIKGYFEGSCTLDAAKELMKKNTRNYAKRQLTWFRKDKRINWVEVGAKDKPSAVANRIIELLKP